MITQTALADRIMPVMEAAFDPAFGEAWNRRQISDALSMPSTHALLVDARGDTIDHDATDGEAAGFVLSRHAADEEELLLIAVLPQARRSGLGDILINALFESAKNRGVARIFLEMRRGNPAEHLYRKAGFQPIGERSQYYRMSNGTRIDAITFGRSL
ncbi:MAG: GNAT family N-acetyltransferase [Pseudomonadota bacterium]